MSTTEHEKFVQMLESYSFTYIPLDECTEEEKKSLYLLFFEDIIPINLLENPVACSSVFLVYIGVYYRKHRDYDRMKMYLRVSIERGNSSAMHELGDYYMKVEKDYVQMKKYLQMASEKGNNESMYFLGWYYRYIEKNYEQMKTYYLMAIERGNTKAMNNLGTYYSDIEKNYIRMKKYYMMAIERGNDSAMSNLGWYYEKVEQNYDLMKKYYLMAIERGNTITMSNLGSYYQLVEMNFDLMKKYYLMAIEKGYPIAMGSLGEYYRGTDIPLYLKYIFMYFENVTVADTAVILNFARIELPDEYLPRLFKLVKCKKIPLSVLMKQECSALFIKIIEYTINMVADIDDRLSKEEYRPPCNGGNMFEHHMHEVSDIVGVYNHTSE